MPWTPGSRQRGVAVALSLAVAPLTMHAQSTERVARYRVTETSSITREGAGVDQRPPQRITTTMHVVFRTRVVGDTTETDVTVDSTRVTAPGIDQALTATVGARYVVTTRPNRRVRDEFRLASGDETAMMELVRIARLMPLRPTDGVAWDTLDLTAPAPSPNKVKLDIRRFAPGSDTSMGGVTMRTIIMQGTSMLSDPGSIVLGGQPVTSDGGGEITGHWYLGPNNEIQYARIDEMLRTKISAGSIAPEVTRVSSTRLELERLRDR